MDLSAFAAAELSRVSRVLQVRKLTLGINEMLYFSKGTG